MPGVEALDDRAGDGTDPAAASAAAFVLALRERGVRDTATLRAMERVPREGFVPEAHRAHARSDIALPLPCGQTMSAPSTVGRMLAALAVPRGARVLEVGTGSGFVAALLAALGAGHVRSLERYATLARAAQETLAGHGLDGISVETADALSPEAAGEGAYDRILIHGVLPELPPHLIAALAPNGRLVGALARDGRPACLATLDRPMEAEPVLSLGKRLFLPPLTPGRARIL